jgi:hypothetical protein
VQPVFPWQAGVQTPDAQASSLAQSLLTEQVHSNVVCVAVHCAMGPHCALDEQLPHAPPAHTLPAGHWLFDVQTPVLPVQPVPLQGTHV